MSSSRRPNRDSVRQFWRRYRSLAKWLRTGVVFGIALAVASITGIGHASAQDPPYSMTDSLTRGLGFLGSLVEQDLPGSTNPYSPLLFPPYFSAEVRVTPVYMNLIKGEIQSNGRTINLETPDGINLSSKGSYIEFMARVQLSRFSFRGHYDVDIRRIPAGKPSLTDGYGHVDWLNWRLGFDIDVISSYGVRVGPSLDYYPERPSLSFNNLGRIFGNSGKVDGYAPVTLGFFASYNPYYSWVLTPTLEFYYRWPFPYRQEKGLRGQMAQVTQWEYALGLKIPRSRALGTFGIRFGARETKLEFGGTHETRAGGPVMLNWNGKFIEFVWFY